MLPLAEAFATALVVVVIVIVVVGVAALVVGTVGLPPLRSAPLAERLDHDLYVGLRLLGVGVLFKFFALPGWSFTRKPQKSSALILLWRSLIW